MRTELLLGMILAAVVLGGQLFVDMDTSSESGHRIIDCSNGIACQENTITATIRHPLSCKWDISGFNNFRDGVLEEEDREVCGGKGYVTAACPYDLNTLSTLLGCEMTEEGVAEVTVVTDPGNYIDTSFADVDYAAEIVSIDQLDAPWDLAFLPDGTLLITQKNGELVAMNEGVPVPVGTVSVYTEAGNGLLGLAVDPDFTENNYIYLLYTAEHSFEPENDIDWMSLRISRFRLQRDEQAPAGWMLGREVVLLDGIRGSNWHMGGRLEFGPEGLLYATTGDALDPGRSQNRSMLEGKVLRIHPDGSIPRANPFDNTVYALGLRNPQGLAWHPETGDLYITMHGPHRHDEINVATDPGTNFGWGTYWCDERRGEFEPLTEDIEPPFFCFDNYTMAPSGAAFVTDPSHPWYGDLFVAGLRGNQIHRFVKGTTDHDIFFLPPERMPNRLRAIEFYDGSLWVIGDETGLVRITPHS